MHVLVYLSHTQTQLDRKWFLQARFLIPPTSHLLLMCTSVFLVLGLQPLRRTPPQVRCRLPDSPERASVSPSTLGLQVVQAEGANPLSVHLLGDLKVWDIEKSPGGEEAGQQGELSLQFLSGEGLAWHPLFPPGSSGG